MVLLQPGSTGPMTTAEIIPALIQSLDDPDGEVRQNLAAALANLGETAVPALIEALEDVNPERRMGAATALGMVRPPPQSAIPALLRVVKDQNDGVRRNASFALSRIVGRAKPAANSADAAPLPPLDPVPSDIGKVN
jgi:HEAT repeat protein